MKTVWICIYKEREKKNKTTTANYRQILMNSACCICNTLFAWTLAYLVAEKDSIFIWLLIRSFSFIRWFFNQQTGFDANQPNLDSHFVSIALRIMGIMCGNAWDLYALTFSVFKLNCNKNGWNQLSNWATELNDLKWYECACGRLPYLTRVC